MELSRPLDAVKRELRFINAAIMGDLQLMEQLIDSGVDINAQDEYNWTALMYACSAGNIVIADFLLRHCANIGVVDSVSHLCHLTKT